ncbi:diaminopropionate ammonia-lyase [Steroidobacter cummioxidans]|uniref:diaminopropionate ammonia-lyase n=1 Tax=Steroidobacter cummioxidans TaxID=1803913 RepID=UPI000E320083|nr:diaminopropionate ammonia-lyase [Steroidobacter cummioxidans]
MRFALNPLASRGERTSAEIRITSRAAAEQARGEIARWREYAPTPVVSLPGIASELGLGRLLLKDESKRLNQGSFKALGGAYAAILRVRQLPDPKAVTLCCATEGNHGRSVAFAAAQIGCSSVIYMHERALEHKVKAIEALGAKVVRTPGNYDDSVRIARAAAQSNGWLLVSDTSDPLDNTVLHVMQGYGVMVLELLEQLDAQSLPTHVFIQGGVGGLAAGLVGAFSDVLGERRPVFVVVEPDTAGCLLESALRFEAAKITGDLQTRMQMLAVGEASLAAWPALAHRVDAFMTVDDDAALAAVARLKLPAPQGAALDISATGVAGFAGLLELMRRQPAVAGKLGLDASARVLVLATEAGPPAQ